MHIQKLPLDFMKSMKPWSLYNKSFAPGCLHSGTSSFVAHGTPVYLLLLFLDSTTPLKMYVPVNLLSFLLILGKMHRYPDNHPGDADHHTTCCNFTCKCVIVKWYFISIHIQQHLSFSILRYLMYCIMSTIGIWNKFFNNLIKIRATLKVWWSLNTLFGNCIFKEVHAIIWFKSDWI